MVKTISVTMEVPKEGKEVIDFVTGILRDIRAKKSIAVITAGSLTGLVKAVEGYENVPEELKSSFRDELTGYTVQQIFESLDKAAV